MQQMKYLRSNCQVCCMSWVCAAVKAKSAGLPLELITPGTSGDRNRLPEACINNYRPTGNLAQDWNLTGSTVLQDERKEQEEQDIDRT
eukprot:5402586-Amphidinium_carterae.1